MSTNFNYPQTSPAYITAPREKKLRRSLFLNICFLVLGAVTVCNLNAVAKNIYDLPQLMSPLILAAGLFGCLLVPGPRVSKMSKSAKINLGMLLLLMLFGWLGILAEFDLMNLLSQTYRLAASIFVFVAAALICGRIAQTYGMFWLLFACFVIFGISSASVFLGVISPSWNAQMSNAARGGRASGFFGNPNEAGTQCCLFVAVGYSLTALTTRTRWLIASLAIAVPACFYTFSRGSFIALFIISISLAFLVFPPKKIVRVMITIMVVCIALFSMKSLIENRMESEKRGSALSVRLQQFNDLLNGRIDSETTNGRSVLAREALREWMKSPFYGNGLGKLDFMPRSGLAPHNLFLKVLGETGLMGLFCFLFGLAVMLFRGLNHKHRFCKVLIIGTVLSLMLDGMAGHGGLTQRNFMFALGMAMAVDYVVTESEKSRRKNPTPRRAY